jgi:hypothetical protein
MVILVLILASIIPALRKDSVAAYGLVSSRKITLSSSANAATDVTYQVSFVTATTSNIGGLVVDFCSNNPIIGDSCTAPTSFDVNEAGLAIANQVGVTDWSLNAATDTNTVVLTRTAANVNSSTTITFDLGAAGGSDGITNPATTNTTFYARILTYSTNAGATGYTPTVPGSEPPLVDAGGVALSTVAQITITSKVQEQLTFCMYTSAVIYTTCTGVSGTAVTLGDTNGVLRTSGAFVDRTTKYNITTNAATGAAIRIKGNTLTTGSFTIAPVGSTQALSAAGTEQFGFCTFRDAGGGTTGLTATAPYDGTGGAAGDCSTTTQTAGTGTTGGTGAGASEARFAYDDNTSTGTRSTYGQQFASKSAGDFSTGIIAFLGNISYTTEAGIYTTTLTFVATGTY